MLTVLFAILPALALASAAPADKRADNVPAFKLQSGRSGNCLGNKPEGQGDKLGMVPCDSAYAWYFPKNERTSIMVPNGLTLGLRGALVNGTPVDGIVPARGGGSTVGQS